MTLDVRSFPYKIGDFDSSPGKDEKGVAYIGV